MMTNNPGSHSSQAKPLVSVCVQTFQHEAFISQCLDGILMQSTDFPFEIIIGEDDSTDGTRQICKAYAEKYPEKIRLFLRSRKDVIHINGRPTGRFNFTQNYQAATGKYIALCEGDDYWTDKNKLQMQVAFLEANPDFVLTHTNVDHVDSNGNVLLHAPLKYKDVMMHEEVAGQITVQMLTMVFRRSALPVFPAVFYQIFNADLFLAALLSEKGKVRFFDIVTGCYRKHGGGVFTGISFRKKQSSKLASLIVMLHYFTSGKVKRNLKTAISKTYGRLLYADLADKDFPGFFTRLREVAGFDFRNFRFSFLHMVNHGLKKTFRR